MMKKKILFLTFIILTLFIAPFSHAADIKPKRVVTENGIILLILERHSLPIVNVNMVIKAGSIYESDEKAGLSSLMSSLLDEGTKTRTSTQIS
ncbi:MAG TPA: insulinase family protein, partial [Nitrospiria bacterium]|nr:insulinase family protein [Nitrospiria bacterium]